ncbi:MAG: hypothetical protein HRU38_17505 [Saccharospirillaceae bacterium]|nr:hypothetical protein [Pseudomonadales bacterium]NRB80436.1 hypothetical protein [Saccharospirillaceae bacterium]
MKIYLSFILFVFSNHLLAKNICDELSIKVELEYWTGEEVFNKEDALKALAHLTNIINDEIKFNESIQREFAIINSQKVIEGYLLKQEALLKINGSLTNVGAKNQFCNFVETAIWVD